MARQPGLVSLIMPTYNRGDTFLKESIRCALRQKYDNLELIIVDDGSTDNTNDIIQEASDDDVRVNHIRLDKNSGCVSIPRAIGIMVANGEYIAHWDDDISHFPTKLRGLVSLLDNNPDKMLAYGARGVAQNGQHSIVVSKDYNPMITWGVDGSQFIYRASVYDKIPLVFCKRGCDWETMKAIWREWPDSFIDTGAIVSVYQWHDGNRSLDEGTKTRIYYPEDYKYWFDNFGQNFEYSLEPF